MDRELENFREEGRYPQVGMTQGTQAFLFGNEVMGQSKGGEGGELGQIGCKGETECKLARADKPKLWLESQRQV